MNVTRGHATLPAPQDVVDGAATFELLATADDPSRVSVLHVHFDAGARTRWHTHPLGQTLIVTQGSGWAQSRGHQARPIAVGDVVSIAPGEEHWHGARSDTTLAHLAIQARDDRTETDVLEPVADHDDPTSKENPA